MTPLRNDTANEVIEQEEAEPAEWVELRLIHGTGEEASACKPLLRRVRLGAKIADIIDNSPYPFAGIRGVS